MSTDVVTVLNTLTANTIFNLKGVVAVVTGGGTGIGLMISSTLMANGATVYIVGPDQKQLDAIASTYNSVVQGQANIGKLVGLRGDVRLKDEARRLADEIGKREGHITILFSNAGILEGAMDPPPVDSAPNSSVGPSSGETSAQQYFERYWAVSAESFDNSLRTNAFAAFWLSAAFLPLLEKWKFTEGGKKFAPQIVITSNMNGWTKDLATSAMSVPYQMSKSAVGHFTQVLAHDLLPLGIRVNGIAPGFFVTEMSAPGSIDSLGQSKFPANMWPSCEVPIRQHPESGYFPIAGSSRDMGTLALFLVANWFVTGETILIDGGTLLRHPSSY